MKFAKTLQMTTDTLPDEYKDKVLNYKKFKKSINRIVTNLEDTGVYELPENEKCKIVYSLNKDDDAKEIKSSLLLFIDKDYVAELSSKDALKELKLKAEDVKLQEISLDPELKEVIKTKEEEEETSQIEETNKVTREKILRSFQTAAYYNNDFTYNKKVPLNRLARRTTIFSSPDEKKPASLAEKPNDHQPLSYEIRSSSNHEKGKNIATSSDSLNNSGLKRSQSDGKMHYHNNNRKKEVDAEKEEKEEIMVNHNRSHTTIPTKTDIFPTASNHLSEHPVIQYTEEPAGVEFDNDDLDQEPINEMASTSSTLSNNSNIMESTKATFNSSLATPISSATSSPESHPAIVKNTPVLNDKNLIINSVDKQDDIQVIPNSSRQNKENIDTKADHYYSYPSSRVLNSPPQTPETDRTKPIDIINKNVNRASSSFEEEPTKSLQELEDEEIAEHMENLKKEQEEAAGVDGVIDCTGTAKNDLYTTSYRFDVDKEELENEIIEVSENLNKLNQSMDEMNEEDEDEDEELSEEDKERTVKSLKVLLETDAKFLNDLAASLSQLSAFQDHYKQVFETKINLMANLLSDVSSPMMNDTYKWRELLKIYIESDIWQYRGKERAPEDIIHQLKQFEKRISKLNKKFKIQKSQQLLTEFVRLNYDIVAVRRFYELNQTAVYKILKKHDKRTHLFASEGFPKFATDETFFKDNIARSLVFQISTRLLTVIPNPEEYACPICRELSYKPIRLDCGHLFCLRCLIKAQKQNIKNCPLCRAKDVVTIANSANLDRALMQKMHVEFPKEVKIKLNQNRSEKAHEDSDNMLQIYGYNPSRPCIIM